MVTAGPSTSGYAWRVPSAPRVEYNFTRLRNELARPFNPDLLRTY